MVEVISDPQDKATPWYYKRSWLQESFNPATGQRVSSQQVCYYPDWRYRPTTRPPTIAGSPVAWDSPIYHITVGSFSDWTWGLSEVYAAIDWARAYKEFLEDWATITRALARFAWKRATRGTAKAVQAAKRQMNTTLGYNGYAGETNPPPVAGAVAIMGEGENLEPIKTAGATTSMEDGRRLLLMVAAAQNLPETFYGDSSVGSLATARSLDRPTELAMLARQQLWREVYNNLCGYQLREAVRVARRSTIDSGLIPLRAVAQLVQIDDTTQQVSWGTDPATGRGFDASINQTWPAIVEIDPKAEIETIMQAAPAIPNPRFIASLILQALRVSDSDDILDELYPPDDQPAAPAGQQAASDATPNDATTKGELV